MNTNIKKSLVLVCVIAICGMFPVASYGLNMADSMIKDIWNTSSDSMQISIVASAEGWDVSEETALTNTVHPLVTFTHTTSGTPANDIGLSLDWYQETAAANTELGARIAVLATDTTAASEDFQIDWMLMTAGATAATKMSLGSTGILTLAGGTTIDNATAATEVVIAETNIQMTGIIDLEGGAVTVNDDSGDYDFTVESNGDAAAIFVDAGNDRVGIFTAAPSVAFEVTGVTKITGATTVVGAAKASSLIVQDAAQTAGLMTLLTATASSGALTGATDKIEVDIPSGALLHSCQLNVDVAVTNDGDNTWAAAYSGGSTAEIAAAATAATKNTKVNTFHDDNAATAITSGETDITLTPQGADFTAGDITAVCYYWTLTSMDDEP